MIVEGREWSERQMLALSIWAEWRCGNICRGVNSGSGEADSRLRRDGRGIVSQIEVGRNYGQGTICVLRKYGRGATQLRSR